VKTDDGRISKEPETVKEFRIALGLNGVWDTLRADTKRWEAFERAWNAVPLESEAQPTLIKSFADYLDIEIDSADTLLGNRFLCRGAGLMLFGPAGQGKSSLIVQVAALGA
jgi:hypothetical protein